MNNSLPILVWVMGPTGAGKSTFMKAMGVHPWVGLIEVGKMMRAKYPPSHFKGHSNPAHTAKEAWQMCLDGVAEHTAAGKRALFCDGQPRDIEQMNYTLAQFPDYRRLYLHIWAPLQARKDRLFTRDMNSPEALELSASRLEGDLTSIYNIVTSLITRAETVFQYDTTRDDYDPAAVLEEISDHCTDVWDRSLYFTDDQLSKP